MASIRKMKFVIGASGLVGILFVNAVVPLLHVRLQEWLSVDERAAHRMAMGICMTTGAVLVLIIVLAWRRLERWRTGRRTWHRRPSQPTATTPSAPNNS